MDANRALLSVITIIAAFIGIGIVVTTLGTQTAQPAYPAAATITAELNVAACEALSNGYWEFTPGTGADAPKANTQLNSTTCPAAEGFSGLLSILRVLPLALVGGGLGLLTTWIIHRRSRT